MKNYNQSTNIEINTDSFHNQKRSVNYSIAKNKIKAQKLEYTGLKKEHSIDLRTGKMLKHSFHSHSLNLHQL